MPTAKSKTASKQPTTINANYVLEDFKACCISRECSLLGRKEVLSGKAKFGIFGDGKEVPQVAMARAFRKGDFRSGYYRDQTFMIALGLCSVEEFFAQLYADTQNDPFSAGRQMNSHFATPLVDKDGNWTNHIDTYNVSSDISPTGGQMARALGLAKASKFYRNNKHLSGAGFSNNGNEVSFVTIGDASTSEGVFWETVNAASVMQVPLAINVWDDGYGISVPNRLQTTKESISEALAGFKLDDQGRGIEIYTAKAWDYPSLVSMYESGVEKIRKTHIPALFHVKEVTQPQGHSTSGDHRRYKSQERLQFEVDYDCITKMGQWIVDSGFADEETLDKMRKDAKSEVIAGAKKALERFQEPIKNLINEANAPISSLKSQFPAIQSEIDKLAAMVDPMRRDVLAAIRHTLRIARGSDASEIAQLKAILERENKFGKQAYNANLYCDGAGSALNVEGVKPILTDEQIPGHQLINKYFDLILERHPEVVAFGEDVGQIGDVNQGFAGLQSKHSDLRVYDAGIREWTIMGEGIGLAMRGIRPIAEIQYLDYLIYGLSPLSDDLATLRYRCNGIQKAPMIVRTRGHRLEGVWHTGSPMGMMLHSLRGIYICTPRNMVQAAGMYNTLLASDDPAIVVECLNGYRLRENLPANLGDYNVPLGIPEVLSQGSDVTLVTYGSCVRVAEEAVAILAQEGITVELIDAQTLLPFDRHHSIVKSLQKTNRLVVMDEDVPGGASAFILQQILEVQGGYRYLDSQPVTIAAAENRGPYGSEGDYFSKPSVEDVVEKVWGLMHEANPEKWGLF